MGTHGQQLMRSAQYFNTCTCSCSSPEGHDLPVLIRIYCKMIAHLYIPTTHGVTTQVLGLLFRPSLIFSDHCCICLQLHIIHAFSVPFVTYLWILCIIFASFTHYRGRCHYPGLTTHFLGLLPRPSIACPVCCIWPPAAYTDAFMYPQYALVLIHIILQILLLVYTN